MDGEMAMRAIDDVEIGEDLTPPLAPLSHALHDSYLKSHCSACFSPLASATSHHHLHVSYCSYSCFASDSPLHSSCSEIDLLQITSTNSSCDLDEDTADLRAALRILTAFPTAGASGRISGLLTNRDKLLECRNIINSGYYSEEILWKIQNGGKAMAAARRAQESTEISEELKNTELMEAALCAVLTNSVEVMDNEGRSLGIAVYGIDFSWVNHSCSPNACYRFEFCSSNSDNVLNPHNSKMRISACSMGAQIQIKVGCCNNGILKGQGHSEYGPRVILRSIRQIESGSEVIIAYTDLLQPKAMRQMDLQSKYQFTCSCLRCSAHPLTYVDQALQDVCVVYDGIPKYTGNTSFSEDAVKKLNDFMDDATSDYFSDSDAESCCVKLEKLLTLNILKSELGSEIGMTFQQNLSLHPFNYLSIKAYITLSSTYKIRASHFDSELISRDRFEASDMLRISAAYSLLLAGATHHLLSSEPSLIVSAANFWTNAGESLLALSRSLQWSSAKSQLPDYTDLSIFPCRCSLIDQNGVNLISSYSAYTNFGSKSRDFLECSTYLSEYVWEFLACRSVYLQRISNPINFNWLGRTSSVSDKFITLSAFDTSSKACNAQKKLYLYQLGIHCLHYGGLLSSICYGEEYHFTTHVKSIIQTEHDIAKASVPNHASP